MRMAKKEHSAKPPKLKRQKLSASSSDFRAANSCAEVKKTSAGSGYFYFQVPSPLYSLILTDRQQCSSANRESTLLLHKGQSSNGTRKSKSKGPGSYATACCEEVFSLSSFQSHAGCSETHASNIVIEDGKSLLDCQMQIMTKRTKRICGPEPHDMMKDNCPKDKNDNICTLSGWWRFNFA
jgi:hypothetical protein